MKLSIVTISFNQAEFLETAIRSVISQKNPQIEYIVVDPGSTDGSRAIIERYREQIDQVIFETDQGPADGLNKGLARATGDWFACLNADDAYLPSGLRAAMDAFSQDRSVGAMVGNGFIADEGGQIYRRSISNRFWLSGALHGACFALHQSTFYRREAFRQVHGFNPENRISWDAEILIRIASRGYRVRRMFKDIGLFRIHPNSITGSGLQGERAGAQLDLIFRDITARERTAFERLVVGPALRLGARVTDPRRMALLFWDRTFAQRSQISIDKRS